MLVIGGVSGRVTRDEGGVGSGGEVVDLARCSQPVYEKRDGEHGIGLSWSGLDTEEEEGQA